MMFELTPKKLQRYVQDYDYEITIEQAKQILEMLDNYYGTFTSTEIEEVTDYIVAGENSVFAKYFN